LADASHDNAVNSATVTMQWEVAQRMVAQPNTKDYGILSVVFQLYADVTLHFKIPPTVFYPKPKVDSALVGLQFQPDRLRDRLSGVQPAHLRTVINTAFQQRRKTLRNSLKKVIELVDTEHAKSLLDAAPLLPLPDRVLAAAQAGDKICANQQLPENWASLRPEQLTPGQFIELTRLLYGDKKAEWGRKVWRKLKHG
jgi:16S rRNA A1518/A1519 N6-dimethyltransferase RsmA/KsgA/DIM1 with predicted DNA glycosylase/AP lyase activity